MESQLNAIIEYSLFAPQSDPDDCHLRSAAVAFKLLIASNLMVYNRESVEKILRGQNVMEQDYLGMDL